MVSRMEDSPRIQHYSFEGHSIKTNQLCITMFRSSPGALEDKSVCCFILGAGEEVALIFNNLMTEPCHCV